MSEPEIYSIDEAGQALGVSPEEIRSYIEEGLVTPRAATGAAALSTAPAVTFTRVEMRRLWSIVTLHRDLGINLPGVAAVLRLREQFEQARRDLGTLVEIVEREMGPDCWDRLWPEGRPRPTAHISVEGAAQPLPGDEHAADSGAKPPASPGDHQATDSEGKPS
jgi:MerR family transcriptional regulator, heat shock protein HspR